MVSGLRGIRYGEVLLAYLEGVPLIEVYNSFGLSDLPEDVWERLDPEEIAVEHDAALAILNGPRSWLKDGIGKIDPVEPFVRDFSGIEMRRVATLHVSGPLIQEWYTERHVNRGAIWFFDPGSVVHEPRAPGDRTSVMQAYCVGVDQSLNEASLESLDGRLQLPQGWPYVTRTLDAELVIDTTVGFATVLQDELHNTYSLID